MVEILLNTILLSVRSGDWHLFMTCVKDIIPYTFAYGNINYARYLTAMFSEMLTLEDDFSEIYEEFVAGNFAVQLSNDSRFSRTEPYKVTEMTLNRDTKTPGVTTGFSTNIGAVHISEISSKYRASLRTAFHQHLDYKSSNYQYKDLAPSRICKDEDDVSALTSVFLETFINAFSDIPMMSISTGIQTAENVTKDLLSAQELGKTVMVQFIKERLAVGSSKSIFDPIKKSKLGTFKSINKIKVCKTKNKILSLTSTRDLFSKIAIISQKRSVYLKTLFNYPLEVLPLSLSEADGTLKKTPKSALLHKLEQDVEPVSDLPIGCAILMDGMALVRQIKTTKMTHSQFATVLLKNVLPIGRDSSRIDVVFDVYLDNSIKDVERNRRSCGELKLQQIIPDAEIKQLALVLLSNDNKNKLIRFIVEH